MTEELKVVISAEMAKYASAMKEALTALNNIQKELKQTNEESDKAKKKTQKMGEAFRKAFKQAKESAEENFKKIGSAIGEGLKKATTAIKDFTISATKTLGSLAVGGFTALSGAIVALNSGTEDYRLAMAKLTSAFEQAGMSAEDATGVYNELYKVMGDTDTAVEASQQIALLTDNFEEASKWGELASGVMGTFGDALQPETFYESANETLRLNEATGAYTQMLEGAGVNVEEFNKKLASLSTEEEKRNFLLETADALMGEAGDAFDENTEKIQAQREAQANLTETLASLGDAVAPIITAFTNLANDALSVVAPYLEDIANEYAPLIEPFFTNLAENVIPPLKEAVKELAGYIGDAISWVVDNWEIIAGIAGVIAIITTAIGLYNVVMAVKQAMDVAQVGTLGALIACYVAQASAMIVAIAPYVAIVAAIVAVIAIIVLCIKHLDEIKEAVGKALDWIKEKTAQAVNAVVGFFTNLWESAVEIVSNLWSDVCGFFTDLWSDITTIASDIWSGVSGYFSNLWDDISGFASDIWETISGVFGDVYDAITSPISDAYDTVSGWVEDILDLFDFDWEIPKPKFPTFSVSGGKAPWGFMGQGSLPRISINWNALGGVFDKPTVFGYGGSLQGIGEAGAEAVVPLEKNTQWLDRIAERLNGNGRDIILQVDGTTLGRVSCQSINQYARQTGTLPIKVF